jgi:predicted DNA-binding transcriptional regulator AlpA
MTDPRTQPDAAPTGSQKSPGPSLAGEREAGRPPRPPELLTLPEAAELTALSVKALTRRIERGTLPSETKAGRRLVRRGELTRLDLISTDSPEGNPAEGRAENPGGGLVIWRDLYEQTAGELAAARAELATARTELARIDGALTAASPFARVRQLRRRLAAVRDMSSEASA